jgi:hypothetical protein
MADVDVVASVVANGGYATISAGLNDVLAQSQSARMLRPAIARVMLLPGFLTMI